MRPSAKDMDKLIGENINKFRLERGMRREDLALALGLSYQQVQKYEKGWNRVAASTLLLIAEILKVSLYDFYGDYPETSDYQSDRKIISLVQCFRRIPDEYVQDGIYEMVRFLSGKPMVD